MSKISQSAADILAKLTAKRDAISRAQEEAAELERAAAWAAGQERRERLAAIGAQVRDLSNAATDTTAQLHDATRDLTAAMQRLIGLADAHNEQLAGLRQRIAGEGVRTHSLGNVPPSPTDAGVGTSGAGLLVGDVHGAVKVGPVNGPHLVDLAAQAARTGDLDALTAALTKALSKVREDVPAPAGPFWRHPENGNVFASAQPLHGCREITRAEYLAASWSIALRDLPDDVLDELSEVERGHLAHELLPAGNK